MLGYFYDQFLKTYAVDFLGSDKSVVERTQKMNYDLFKTKAVKIPLLLIEANIFFDLKYRFIVPICSIYDGE